MINGSRVVAVIPARMGSKTVPGKNIKSLAGKPLIAWSIETSLRCEEVDRTIVSTDGDAIAEVGHEYGAEIFKRPDHLASDSALIIDSLRDLCRQLREEGETAKYMVLLEATSPFRRPRDIRACLDALESGKYDSVATFVEASLNPHRAWAIKDGTAEPFIEGAVPWLPRQELPSAWQLNGGVYAFSIDVLPVDGVSLLFGKSGAVEMPIKRSIDLDNEIDFLIAEAVLKMNSIAKDSLDQ
ncbi:MAG: acylneuraminate cytidylyltransferase family protein [Candidatus Nitrohelix vancouverensis]|uniref:Acylneuraminate cytidylyltransferase family protein n=1 Tax=Candidatus Nitrohelix vancouverensis TaxID=2705534 RepID=A0A7T0C033_9BACT|nr:MAG: acylneuraminate cytidylyltransferase family protein [Candidatus Nitrohelix vancouverensis]